MTIDYVRCHFYVALSKYGCWVMSDLTDLLEGRVIVLRSAMKHIFDLI